MSKKSKKKSKKDGVKQYERIMKTKVGKPVLRISNEPVDAPV